ncbi:MAG: cyclic nucleotide-binding domain-containing protein [Elusimicrobiota bacterium]
MVAKKLDDGQAAWLTHALKQLNLFSHLNMDELNWLLDSFNVWSFKKGAAIINKGDRGDFFGVVYSGSLEVWVPKVAIPVIGGFWRNRIAVLGKGEYFGEMALIRDEPRSANISALEATTFFALYKKAMDFLVKKNATAEMRLKELIEERDAQRRWQR